MFEYLRHNQQSAVYLNIYNFWSKFNKGCGCVGLGVYHTAIEIQGIQYMFYGFDGDESGVIEIQPKSASYEFSEQFLLGYTQYGYYELETQVLQPLRLEFLGNRYDLLNNNCNHFALRMSEMLGFRGTHPGGKIFRITNFFNMFRCCIPNCILSGRLDWFAGEQQFIEIEQSLNDQNSKRRSMRSMRSISSLERTIKQVKYEQLVEQQEQNIKVIRNDQSIPERGKRTPLFKKSAQQQTTQNHESNI